MTTKPKTFTITLTREELGYLRSILVADIQEARKEMSNARTDDARKYWHAQGLIGMDLHARLSAETKVRTDQS